MVDVTFLVTILSALAGILALVMAIVVFRAQSESRMNRRLAALLATDGLFLLYLAFSDFIPMSGAADAVLLNFALSFDALAHFLFIITLDSPTSRILRKRWIVVLAVLITLAVVVVLPLVGLSKARPATDDLWFASGWPLLGLASVFAFGVALDAYLRTPKGTPSRRRSGMFALAFGTRDATLAITILTYGVVEGTSAMWLQDYLPLLLTAGSFLFVVLLTYALLSVQLFDIDLKVKVGISRSGVVVFIVIAALIVSKIVEFYLNKTLGFVFGGVAAGLTLFFAPRLNKFADKVANAALPNVQPTSEYLSFKKLEVYRAAVESAAEGGLGEKERGLLDRLQSKLGLSKQDALAIEAEVMPATKPTATPA